MEVAYDVFEMPGQTGLKIITYSPPPGTDTAEKFALLASWAASHDAGHPAQNGPANQQSSAGIQPPTTRDD